MAKYAEAESHTWRSRTPRRTSDHLKDSASAARVLVLLVEFYQRRDGYLPFSSLGIVEHKSLPPEFLFFRSQERC
jgi:hypothetical protein